ncbi:unnamed protein product [Oreochromis niloticus]|nr:unnamed protein product [Mustela putorius furo]
MDLEELAETVSQTLWNLQLDQLKEVCAEAKIPSGNVTTRRALIKLITESMDKVINDEEQDVALYYLKKMLESVDPAIGGTRNTESGGNTTSSPQGTQETREEVNLAERYAQLQRNSEALQEEIRRLSERVERTPPSQPTTPQHVFPVAANRLSEVTIRREFKICGQIGEKGQKDRLSYTNLMHQIDRGLNKGHSEAEVIEAVVKSVSPGLSLRDMLEIKRDLTLPQLKAILKGHFKEDSTTDLYHRLVNVTQDSRESPQNFLFRAIELKERLLLASEDTGSDEQYSPELIQKKFLRSVSTGLLSDPIKFQLKSYLDDPRVTDETLIDKMNEAASVESERQLKQKKTTGSKSVKVNELQTERPASQLGLGVAETRLGTQEQSAEVVKPKSRRTPVVAASRESELHETVRLLREEMAELRRSITTPQGPTRPLRTSGRRGCKACQEQGTNDGCEHCFKCGQPGHLSRGCRGRRGAAERSEGTQAAIQTIAPPKSLIPIHAEADDKLHELLWNRIRQLEAELEQSGKAKETVGTTYASHLSLRCQAKLRALIGKKCMVDCFFEGVETQALWDTGSQVTIINENWRKSCFPHIQLRSTSELLGEDEALVGKAANQTPIPFAGWVELKFRLGSTRDPQPELVVPVLVSKEPGVAEPPIIGYNVIEHFVKDGMEQHPDVTPAVVKEAFSIDCKKAEVLINIVQHCHKNDEEGVVKVGRQKIVIPAGQSREVKCSVRTGPLPLKQEVLFEPEDISKLPEGVNLNETVIGLQRGTRSRVVIPVTNGGSHDITLLPHAVLGRLQQVKAIYPVDVRPVSAENMGKLTCASENTGSTVSAPEQHKGEYEEVSSCSQDLWDPPVSVDHLTPDQQEQWRSRMQEAYRLASETAQKERNRAKRQYDRKAHGVELQPGCRVLVRNFRDRGGPGKLRSYWEERVHVVLERKHKDSPVYAVQPERGPGKVRVLHRNLLLPCDFLPVQEDKLEKNKNGKEDAKQQRKGKTQEKQQESDHDSSSEDEGDWGIITTQSAESPTQIRSQLRAEAEEFQPEEANGELSSGGVSSECLDEGEKGGLESSAEEEEAGRSELSGEENGRSQEQVSSSDEEDEGEPNSQPVPTRKYPFRCRNPPKTLTYDTLGQPSVINRHK